MIKLIESDPTVHKVPYGSLKSGETLKHSIGLIMIKTDHTGDFNLIAATSLTDGTRYSILKVSWLCA